MKKSIAVIGNGFVGGSLTTVFSERGFKVYVADKAGLVAQGGDPVAGLRVGARELAKAVETGAARFGGDTFEDPDRPKNFSGVYFVCVPTPMFEDGSADLSIVESVLEELASVPGERVAVIKSTVPPGSTKRWNERFNKDGLFVVFNPEFLTEATALDDMRNQNRVILGGPRPHINRVKQLFQQAFPTVPLIKTSSTTAEMVKYLTNCFLATKVAFANEMLQICETLDATGLDIDFDKVVEYAKYDERVGKSHWLVPGPDGGRGFSGHCFPKDLNSLMFLAKELGVDPKVMTGVWEKNLEVRPERDWELMVGRAVSKRKT